jgi:hypothetical protein
MTGRRFLALLVLIAVAALGVRVLYVLVAKADEPLLGDQIYYSAMADTLADGGGFRDPFIADRVVPSADHPPLTALVATPASWIVGTDSDPSTRILAHRLTMAVVGSLAVLAIGFAARAMAGGTRDSIIGLLAAAIAAVHPGLWINDGLVMSESVGALTIALVIWAAAVALRRPSDLSLAVLGAATGLACLARSEALLMFPLLVLPVALSTRFSAADAIPRWRRFVLASAGGALLLAPWLIPNLIRFEEPTTLSTNDGLTLIGTNCDAAWNGPSRGLWIFSCIEAVDSDGDGIDDWTEYQQGSSLLGDEADYSVVSKKYRDEALSYLGDNITAWPPVVANRVMRVWGVWDPAQLVDYNTGEGREPWANWLATVVYWILLPLSIVGLFLQRRFRQPTWPLGAQYVAATITAGLFYGLWRFRIGAEVAIVIGAAIAVVWLADRLIRRFRPQEDGPARIDA